MKPGSLRTRVTSWYVAFLGATLVVFGGSLYFGLAQYLELSLDRSLADQANSIAERFLPELAAKGQSWFVGEVTEAYAPDISGRFIRITAEDGSVVYQSGTHSSAETRELSVAGRSIPRIYPAPKSAGIRRVGIGSLSILVYSLPYTVHGTQYLIETGVSRGPITRLLRGLVIALLLFASATLIAAAFGGRLLMSRPLRPLVTLADQAERIGASSIGDRLPVIATGDELERLSLSLNRMIARLEDALAYNRRFSADVSHELRTPLTILRGELELLIEQPSLSPCTTDVVGSALEEIDRMTKIVESLLAISRIDAGGELTRTPVDLRLLALTTTEQLRLLAEEKHVGLECSAVQSVVVLGDAIRLSQVIVNLVDNAIKYTPAGGRVVVTVDALGSAAVLKIEDNGAGIPQECIAHVFERFYRADKARSRDSGGAGLGLSIVKAICAAHDAEISLESVEGRGTCVRVEMPLERGLPGDGDPAAARRAQSRLPAIHVEKAEATATSQF